MRSTNSCGSASDSGIIWQSLIDCQRLEMTTRIVELSVAAALEEDDEDEDEEDADEVEEAAVNGKDLAMLTCGNPNSAKSTVDQTTHSESDETL
jgi:hypothetical protein